MVSLMHSARLRKFLACNAVSSAIPSVIRSVQSDAVYMIRCSDFIGDGFKVLHSEVWLLRNSSAQPVGTTCFSATVTVTILFGTIW